MKNWIPDISIVFIASCNARRCGFSEVSLNARNFEAGTSRAVKFKYRRDTPAIP